MDIKEQVLKDAEQLRRIIKHLEKIRKRKSDDKLTCEEAINYLSFARARMIKIFKEPIKEVTLEMPSNEIITE